MIRIKALNDQSDYSDSSDSDYQVTREAEEEELNELYINSLKYATEGNVTAAIQSLEQLKSELEIDSPKIKDAFLLERLKYLTYKNLGLFKNDLDLILDALEIDDSDINLWITAGRKSKEKCNYILSKHCFESAYNFNQSNYIVIDNLIDLYFITNNLYRCVTICFQALEKDPDYLKAKVMINECIRLMPPILEDIDNEYRNHISVKYGGLDFDFDENKLIAPVISEIIEPLNNLKYRQFFLNNEDQSNKKKSIILNLDRSEHSTFEKIGLKIKNTFDLIQKSYHRLCMPIFIDFDGSVENMNEESNDVNKNIENDKNDNEDSQNGKNKKNEQCAKEQKINEKLLLYEYVDKRRSSRVKTKSKNSDFDDDQSLFDQLLQLLPEKLRMDNIAKNENSTIDTEYISSNSASAIENDLTNLESRSIESESVTVFFQKLKQITESQRHINIFKLLTFYLTEIIAAQNIIIPQIFMDLYKIYREHYQLPCGLVCKIGEDITVDMIQVCLAANEIEYQKSEIIFLKQILFKLQFYMDPALYRQFLIRLFVLCGSKDFDSDLLEYALDLCQSGSQYWKHFVVSYPNCDAETKDSLEVTATNKLKINPSYINTLIEMQTVSISKLSSDKNYSEIIRILFTKSEKYLSMEEKKELCEAIVKAELWQKGIDFFENWSHFTDDCLDTILLCVQDKKANLSSKLAKKIAQRAAEGMSTTPWMILYWCFITEDVDQASLVKFFTLGHNLLGKRGLCTGNEGQFLLLAQKVFFENDFEDEGLMCFTCLFNFPPKKNLSSSDTHISPTIDLKWSHCFHIYEYFIPEFMPEFDTNPRNGITLETKEFFLKILNLIPNDEKPKHTIAVTNYIKRGENLEMPDNIEDENSTITSSIYYLLADHHFKAKDFAKAKYFFINDLALNPNRFDSWASLALSINYQLDQMLIEGKNIESEKFHQTAFSAMQCYIRALELQPDNSKIWIEYGLLCYNVASNWSRLLKRIKMFGLSQEITNQFYSYESVLEKAKNCFEKVLDIDMENEESWLSYYMLGKISEKSKSDLLTILRYYEWAYLTLYLEGAVYPKKINYYNPAALSIEALEVHYRIHSVILKYLLNNRKFTARMLRYLKFHLVKVNKSPFVLRKPYSSCKRSNGSKQSPCDNTEDGQQISDLMVDVIGLVADREVKFDVNRARNELIQMCVSGIKKCLSRYNGHYKSYYRLAHYYHISQDNCCAKAILCGGPVNKTNPLLRFEIDQEKPDSNPGYINGLFFERKPSNLYNGIWCIPIDEIERAGNFNSHMFRCTSLLIKVCEMTYDYHMLSSIAVQLHKTPDQDKKYVNDTERLLLSKMAFEKCFCILENKLFDPQFASNQEAIFEEIKVAAQNMIKFNVYQHETLQIFNRINDRLMKNQL